MSQTDLHVDLGLFSYREVVYKVTIITPLFVSVEERI